MKSSAYSINERASTTLGLTLSHPVNALIGHRGNHIVTHTSPVYTTAKVNRRQLIADKGSFDGGLRALESARTLARGLKGVRNLGCMLGSGLAVQIRRLAYRATFRAALPERCFRYLDCFNGGEIRPCKRCRCGRPCQQPRNVWQVGRHRRQFMSPATTFKAVSIPSSLDRNIKDNQGGCLYEWPTYNQIQALTTPVNLVGGAERLDHTNHFVGSMTAQ